MAHYENEKIIEENRFHTFLMHSKYLSIVRKITKGITHEYNNIFTGLAGQMRTKRQGTQNGALSKKQGLLVKDLLERGIEKTGILYEFSREVKNCKKQHSPRLLAAKAFDLLNTVSRLHCFHVQSAADLPKIHANHRDIILMLLYLGENAIEAMPKGGKITVEIVHLHTEGAPPSIQFRMTDHGIGFSEEIKKNVYEPFVTTKSEDTVYGLGLYAAQAIVKDHQGSLHFEKGAKGGTIAVVDIPALGKKRKGSPKQPLSQHCAPSKTAVQKQVFLVVDDDAAVRDMLLKSLLRRGHVVFCVASCKEALLELHLLADTVTVALIDIGLRDTNGYECGRLFRTIKKDIHIIFMSGADPEPEIIEDLQAAFINKPFSIDHIEQIASDAKL